MVILNPLKFLLFLSIFGLVVGTLAEAIAWVYFGVDLGLVGEPK
tara:strand:- start:978 stop:1109 length:132 start_codon:yes stop_codon:yes gene_type:complete